MGIWYSLFNIGPDYLERLVFHPGDKDFKGKAPYYNPWKIIPDALKGETVGLIPK